MRAYHTSLFSVLSPWLSSSGMANSLYYPYLKNGDKSMVSNYRKISLLCIVSKALEKIIYKHTINLFSDLFTNHQFGFIPGRSSLQQLLLFVNDLIVAKENLYEVDTIYVDFLKSL